MSRIGRVDRLKIQAREALLAYQRAVEGLDCGNEIAKHISERASAAAQRFNDAMSELSLVDPNCPRWTPL